MLFDKVLWQTFSTDIWRASKTTSADYLAEVIFLFLAFRIPNNRLDTDTLTLYDHQLDFGIPYNRLDTDT